MIVEAIFNLIALLILGVISLFPTIPIIDTSGLDGLFNVLSLIDSFVSLRAVSVCFVVIFIFMNIQIVWGIIMWVVRKIPGVE
jgi:ABC-type sulfate transport system permease subunit